MSKIREVIPDSIYGIFRKDRSNLFLLMDYLCGISTAISESAHYISGITRQDCIDVFESVVSSVVDLTEDTEGFCYERGTAFNYLVDNKWLTKRYDPDSGDDLYTITDGCKPFIALFKTLNMEPEASASIKRVYASVNMFVRGPLSGQVEDLRTAFKDLIYLNQEIAASAGFIEKQIDAMMKLENGKLLIEGLLQTLEQTKQKSLYNEKTDAGMFRLVLGALRRELNETCVEILENTSDDEKAEAISSCINMLCDEAKRAGDLYNEMLVHKSDICTKALSKYRYLETAGSKESDINVGKLHSELLF